MQSYFVNIKIFRRFLLLQIFASLLALFLCSGTRVLQEGLVTKRIRTLRTHAMAIATDARETEKNILNKHNDACTGA